MLKPLKKISIIFGIVFILSPWVAGAKENITDWYLKDFQSEIVVNQDSTLLVTERITADCDNLPNKHGIFRVVPTQVYKSKNEVIKIPVELISLTDFNDQPIKYSQKTNSLEHSISWQIGDPHITVTGENYYTIKYRVKNTIRFDGASFDEFYWNLNGNFWQIETEKFSANIIFPQGVTQSNTKIDYYTDEFGSTDKSLASYQWVDKHTLQFTSNQTLLSGQGITVSVTTPKGIFVPYKPTFWEKYAYYGYFLIPIFVFIFCYLLWSRYGKDPKTNPTIVPEFGVPEKLAPMEMGMVLSDGIFKPESITAEIIHLATKKILTIENIAKKGIFGKEDYNLTLLAKNNKNLTLPENKLIKEIFGTKDEVKISSLKNKFYQSIPEFKKIVSQELVSKKLLLPRSRKMQGLFLVLAAISFFFSFYFLATSIYLLISLFLTSMVLLTFSFFMKIRPLEGAKLLQRIKGFELYMKTAEKYRQRFNEKENIFEKYLPYAILFGITGLWIKKMKEIYGEGYFSTYHPAWFVGASFATFDEMSFNSALSSLSSNMSSTLASSPSSSGAGGGGFSGGGGGGGGGGGW